ncbi:MAG: LysR family transcriptional regulator [Anaerolineae bacterium]|jgi:DNA-binding transcriptional LysR family regulator|nr:LysR family transcriptional regulator [Anaerolineae bacterium]MDH7473798.1 LysR family transcriptional regulator [Anaerolineae bacterium]
MRLAYLRTFVEVAQRKSFSAAAQVLGISQPAVSQQMRRLEEELGVRLLLREGRGPVALTESGKVVLDFARSTLAGLRCPACQLARVRRSLPG